MILPKVILESQDNLVSSSEGPQDGFFSFSSGGYLVGGELAIWFPFPASFPRFFSSFAQISYRALNLYRAWSQQFSISIPLANRSMISFPTWI